MLSYLNRRSLHVVRDMNLREMLKLLRNLDTSLLYPQLSDTALPDGRLQFPMVA